MKKNVMLTPLVLFSSALVLLGLGSDAARRQGWRESRRWRDGEQCTPANERFNERRAA
jgi:hypothetical protein